MGITAQSTVATGDTIEAAYSNTNRDNVAILDARTGGDPGAANKWIVSSGPVGAAWSDRAAEVLAAIGFTPVNKAGDTMTGDLSVRRTATPGQGYLILGNNTAYFVGFDGSALVLQAPNVFIPSDTYIYRAGAPTTGFIALGNSLAHFLGFDGTNVVTETGKVWTQGTDGPASGLEAQTAASATTAGTASSATTAGTAGVANSVAAGSVTDVGIAAGNKDGGASTPSMRTLGAGANQAAAGNHNHGIFSANGSYTGNGGGNRIITGSMGFQPRLVVVHDQTAGPTWFMVRDNIFTAGATGTISGGSCDANGFTVPSGLNTISSNYAWSAFA